MGVIGKKWPAVTSGMCFRKQPPKPFQKIFTVLLVSEYVTALNPTDHYMVKHPWGVESCCAWHECISTKKAATSQVS
jgi:hypothetical protein